MATESNNPFTRWTRLEQRRLGTRVVLASDDFFAPKERLIDSADPVFVADRYDDHGKWMDGWESRRRRDDGHDYCIIRLGMPGVIHGLDIDTSHFTGNFPPAASVDACVSDAELPGAETEWEALLPEVRLGGDAHHYLPVRNANRVTHLRLNIYPDGGVARLRAYGEVVPDWSRTGADDIVDLVAVGNGGRALACSDQHFGSMHNLLVAGRAANMGDGWETARRRGPGNDWVILALGRPGTIEQVEIDTLHFKGNYPDRASIQAALVKKAGVDSLVKKSGKWPTLLPEYRLEADKQHVIAADLQDAGVVSHVRLNIIPDGGVSRLRLHGRISPAHA